MSRPRHKRGVKGVGIEHGTVDAQPDVAGLRRHDAAEARAVTARHPGLERELRRHIALGTQRPDRLEHRRRAARVDLGRATGAIKFLGHELGNEPGMSDAAVVGGDARPGEQFRAGGVRGIPEPEQR